MRGTLRNGQPCLLLGVSLDRAGLEVLTLGQEGELGRLPFSEVTVDWRYDVRKDAWIDQNLTNGQDFGDED